MDWIVAWEKANRDLSEASKLYDRVCMLQVPARRAMGAVEYLARRHDALERFKMADHICTKLRQTTHRSRYKPRAQEAI